MKIYLSPSDQRENKYAAGGTNESMQCVLIANAAKAALDRNGYETIRGSTGKTIAGRIAESNAWNADVHVAIHTNAGGGDGTLVMCHTANADNKYVKSVYNAVAKISPGKDDGIRARTDLAEINGTKALCIYLEVEFHDDPELAEWIIDDSAEIGETIAEAFCKVDGIPFKSSPGSAGRPLRKVKYYVQCGAFALKKNALALAKKLKADGYEVYIKEE